MNENQKLSEVMEFDKIDKISDDLYNLGSNVIIRFNVILSIHQLNNQQKKNFHKEYEYTNKYQEKSVTIRRNFDYYLSIENIVRDPSNGEKTFIRIGLSEFFLFKQSLEIAASWFTDSKYSRLFIKDINGKIKLAEPIPETVIRDLPMDKSLKLIPTVIEKGNSNDDQKCGVRMYYSKDEYTDIELGKFMGLVYLVSTFNMYQCALEAINYIGRPEFGHNRFNLDNINLSSNSYNNINSDNSYIKKATGIKGRIVKQLSSKEDISDLEG